MRILIGDQDGRCWGLKPPWLGFWKSSQTRAMFANTEIHITKINVENTVILREVQA